MNSSEITKYLQIAKKRVYWVVIPFLCTVLGGFGYLLKAPKTYEAQTFILVQPQRVPQDYVRSLISIDIDARLKTISQQVLSRTNLEKTIQQFGLFKEEQGLNLDDKVQKLRRSIKIEVGKVSSGRRGEGEGGAFTITYRGYDPRKVKTVTDALASNFISENLLMRESQALGTSAFLTDELESVRRRLALKEEELKSYRERYMGGLPEQLDTNLRILERTQAQADLLVNRLRDLENRRLAYQKEIATLESPPPVQTSPPAWALQPSEPRDLASMKAQLSSLTARYTEMHPDVVKLKKTIAQLESESAAPEKPGEQGMTPPPAQPPAVAAAAARAVQIAERQVQEAESEIQKVRSEIEKNNEQIKQYQGMIEDTPKREQELLSLRRDYTNLKDLYDSLLKRKLEAEIAVSMEKKQQGEQFRVIDPAKEPLTPVSPDIPRVILITLCLGVGLGCGLAYLMEIMEGSFHLPEECEKSLKIPVLVSIPFRFTESERRRRRRNRVFAAASITAGFLVCAAATFLVVNGVQSSLSLLRRLLERI